jgi:hypothetical protein
VSSQPKIANERYQQLSREVKSESKNKVHSENEFQNSSAHLEKSRKSSLLTLTKLSSQTNSGQLSRIALSQQCSFKEDSYFGHAKSITF